MGEVISYTKQGIEDLIAGLVPSAPSSGLAPAGVEAPLIVYGHSFTTDPGPATATPGYEFWKSVKNRLNMFSAVSYGVSGSWMRHVLAALWGSITTTTSGLPVPPAGAKWTGARRGVLLLDTLLNDAQNITNRSGVIGVDMDLPFTPKQLKAHVDMLRTVLAILEMGSVVNDVTGTKVGAWTVATTNAAQQSVDTNWTFTTTPGDNISMDAVVPAGVDHVWAMVIAWDPLTATSAAIDVAVDGVTVLNVPAADLVFSQYDETGAIPVMSFTPQAIRIPVLAGNRTIRLTHAGTAGQYLWTDGLIVPKVGPPPVIVMDDPNPIANAALLTQPQVNNVVANMDQLRPAWQAVVDEFPNARFLPSTMPVAGLSLADGVHPSDRGMRHIANDVAEAIVELVGEYEPDSMYTLV